MTMPCRGAFIALATALAVLSFACGAQAAPRAAELGPEVAITEPSGGYVGRLDVSPQHGPVGTPLTIHSGPGQTISGTFAGIESDGALRLELEPGVTEIVRAGDVEL